MKKPGKKEDKKAKGKAKGKKCPKCGMDMSKCRC